MPQTLHDTKQLIQDLFDSAVDHGAAPGFQFTVFDKDQILVNGVSGHAAISSESSESIHMRADHVHCIASAGKIATSVVALIILERGLAENGMTLNELDSHDKLVEILPEFKHGSGHLVTKIIEGFEPGLDAAGRKIPVLRDVRGKVTLRMLMTHTAGLSYVWNHPLIQELYHPTDGSVPIKRPLVEGLIDSFDIPLVHEPGVEVQYGVAAGNNGDNNRLELLDWLGQFIVRSTGRSLRALMAEWILEPLGISLLECDTALTAAITERGLPLHCKSLEGKGSMFIPFTIPFYSEEGVPAPGYAHWASAPLWSSTQMFSKLLQAVLRHDKRLLSEETWRLAEQDALKAIGAKVPVPMCKTSMPDHWNDVVYFCAPVNPEKAATMNLLQCPLALGPTLSGRPAGAFGWGGAANTYYGIDPISGIGWIYSAQVFPFFKEELVRLRDDFEGIIYQFIVHIWDMWRVEQSSVTGGKQGELYVKFRSTRQ